MNNFSLAPHCNEHRNSGKCKDSKPSHTLVPMRRRGNVGSFEFDAKLKFCRKAALSLPFWQMFDISEVSIQLSNYIQENNQNKKTELGRVSKTLSVTSVKTLLRNMERR